MLISSVYTIAKCHLLPNLTSGHSNGYIMYGFYIKDLLSNGS